MNPIRERDRNRVITETINSSSMGSSNILITSSNSISSNSINQLTTIYEATKHSTRIINHSIVNNSSNSISII